MLCFTGCSAQAEDAKDALITTGITAVVDVLAAVLNLVILAGGTWLAQKLAGYLKLKTIAAATEELTKEALETVGELQQTLVENMKAKNGGQLTNEDIELLKDALENITLKKLSTPCMKILEAAAVDIIAKIHSVGEKAIDDMHRRPAQQETVL